MTLSITVDMACRPGKYQSILDGKVALSQLLKFSQSITEYSPIKIDFTASCASFGCFGEGIGRSGTTVYRHELVIL